MKIAKPAIKSQIAAMDGHVVVKAPESAVAQFVNGDINGGESAHNYRMTVIEGAIQEAYKGNSRALIEARTFAQGKGKKAKAYAAGFDAVGVPARVQYKGKLDSAENVEARAAIARGLASSAFDFESAFLTVMQSKPAPRVKKTDPAPVEATNASASASASEEGDAVASVIAAAQVEVSDVIATAVAAVAGGLAGADDIAALEAAIAQYRAGAAVLAAMESASNDDWMQAVAAEAAEAIPA